MLKCKACNNDMDMEVIDEASGTLEICCSECQTKANNAIHTGEWNFEGLWWDKHWGDGKDAWNNFTEA